MENDGFTLVKQKGARKAPRRKVVSHGLQGEDQIPQSEELNEQSYTRCISQVTAYQEECGCSAWMSLLTEYLRHCLGETNPTHCLEIRCLGLGSPSNSIASRQQLSTALKIKRLLQDTTSNQVISDTGVVQLTGTTSNQFISDTGVVKIAAYDPVFNTSDRFILEGLGVTILDHDSSLLLNKDLLLVVFAIHCDKDLYERFLFINWEFEKLKRIIIIGNSFSSMGDHIEVVHSDIKLFPHLLESRKFMLERKLPSKLCLWPDAFNDTSIHSFCPPGDLTSIN